MTVKRTGRQRTQWKSGSISEIRLWPEGRKGRDTMRMNLRTRVMLVAGLVLCHLLLAGCGGGFTGNPSIFG